MDDRVRRAVVAGTLGALSIFLGLTRLGFIPWFAGAALTIMHVPVIIGAVIEGPVVGLIVGALFGGFSLLQAAIAPTGPIDVFFTNPLVSILPRLLIGPVAWLVFRAIRRTSVSVAAVIAGIAGTATNTVLVLGMLGVLGAIPWAVVGTVAVANGLPEAGLSSVITVAVLGAWRLTAAGKRAIATWSGGTKDGTSDDPGPDSGEV